MSFVDYLEKLQKKPRHIKIQIMWICAIICMVFIFSVWVWSLGNSINKRSQTADNSSQIDTSKLMGGLSQIKEDIPTLWQSLGAGIGSLLNSSENSDSLQNGSAQNEGLDSAEKLPVE